MILYIYGQMIFDKNVNSKRQCYQQTWLQKLDIQVQKKEVGKLRRQDGRVEEPEAHFVSSLQPNHNSWTTTNLKKEVGPLFYNT